MGALTSRMGAMIAALLLPFAATAQSDPSEQDKHAFRDQAVAQFQAALPDARFERVTEDPLVVTVANHAELGGATLNLHRLFGYCQTVEANVCSGELERVIIALTAEVDDPEPSDLRIIVRDAQYWAYTQEIAEQSGTLPIHRQIGEDLFAILAIDSPKTIRVASQGDLAVFKLDQDAAWKRAAEQTGLVIPPLPLNRAFGRELLGFESDEYTGTMLLFLPQWAQIAERVGPDMVVSVTSDQLVVAGTIPEGESLDRFKTLVAEDCARVPRCISPHVYRLRDSGWTIVR